MPSASARPPKTDRAASGARGQAPRRRRVVTATQPRAGQPAGTDRARAPATSDARDPAPRAAVQATTAPGSARAPRRRARRAVSARGRSQRDGGRSARRRGAGRGHVVRGYRRRLASEGLVRRASSSSSCVSVAVSTAAPSSASASTSPNGSDDQRVAGVARPGLAGASDEDGVLDRPRPHQSAPVVDLARPGHPGRRHHQQLGAPVDQGPGELGEAQVVAGHQADPEAADLDHLGLGRSRREPVGLAVAEGVVEVDLAVVGRAPLSAHHQGVERPLRVRSRARTCRPRRWYARGRRRGRPRWRRARRRGSANALTSEPASPKSRANASGKTTRSVSVGAQLGRGRRG